MKDFEMYKKIFAERLKQSLDGKSILAFSKSVSIPERTLNAWIRGETTPRMEYLILLAKTLSCSVDYLVGLEDY